MLKLKMSKGTKSPAAALREGLAQIRALFLLDVVKATAWCTATSIPPTCTPQRGA